MMEDRQSLLKELQNLKRQRDGKRKRMAYLEESVKEVKEYKKHQDDVLNLQEEIDKTIHQIQCHCKHTFFETGVDYDKILDTKIWKLKCIECGFETLYYQMSDLENLPNKEIIMRDNKGNLDFDSAKRYFGKLEKEVGEEEARREVLALGKK